LAAALGLVAGIFASPQAAVAGTCKLGACGGMGTAYSFTEKEEPGVRPYSEKAKEEIAKNKEAFQKYAAKETKEERVARQMKQMKAIAKDELTYTGRTDVVY